MASVTKEIGSFGDQVTFSITYDNVSNLLTALRCKNDSEQDAIGEATLVANGRSYSKIFQAHTDTNIAIPTQKATRLDITVDANGRVNGVEYHFSWPYGG